MDSRQEALADLMAASAVGTALATVFGGLAAYLDAWRLAFAGPALAGVALAVLLTRLPEPKGFASEKREGPLVLVGRVLGRPWAVVVVGIALVEGGVILGCLTFLAPSLERVGFNPAVAGLAVGLYGLAVLGWTDRKSTRLNSSHANISYAVFCLKKKKIQQTIIHMSYA